MDVREILGMDSNAIMPIGIGALQKLLYTLKDYKIKSEDTTHKLQQALVKEYEKEVRIEDLQAEIIKLNADIEVLTNATVKIRMIDSIDLQPWMD